MTHPLIRIISGKPTDEEVAALISALLALAGRTGTGRRPAVATSRRAAWPGSPYRSPTSWR